MIGVRRRAEGQVPLGFVVLKAGVERDDAELDARARRARARAHRRRSPRSSDALVVARLPKTRSGKILRGDDARDRRRPRPTRVPPTIDDPAILDEIAAVLGRAL